MLPAEPVVHRPHVLLHRFRLERLLGRGGAGEVHAAYDLLQDRHVALKLLRPDAADPELGESLRAEFRILRGLSHPGIVQVFDFGHAADRPPFYTMELLDGHDLAAVPGDVDPHALLEQVGRALDYLHSSGLVHSDLKPSNVFRVGTRFKLTDFGLVRRTQRTRRETPYGTLAYMPPERLRAAEGAPDPREDLYALGAILFEVLCGRPPYAGATSEATRARILSGDLETELAAVPEAWGRLLRRLLASDPNARFERAWDLLQAWGAQFDRPALAPPVWAPPFVGRRRELAAIRSALAEMPRGRGALFFIAGPPGVGKSALLEVVAAQAAASGMPCWRFESPAAPRALALLEGLSSLYRRWRPGLPVDLDGDAEQLAAWPDAVQAATTDEALLNVHAHALAALRRVAAAAPHVLLIDDAHRLDHASRALLRFMAAGARDLGVVVLVGGRAAGAALGTPAEETDSLAQDLIQARHDGGAVQICMLRELGADDVATLVRRRFEAGPELEPLAQRVYDLTHGHPFFVTEALQHLLATGQLRRQAGGWQLLPQTASQLLPRMADTILSELVAAARHTDRAIYEVLALFPAGASPALLARVVGQNERRLHPALERSVRDALERGVRIGLLTHTSDGYRFGHELIREACAARFQVATAKRYHSLIADALAGTPSEAHHRLSAGERTPQSRECYLREARNYEARRAPWEALRFYSAALEILPDGADADELALCVAGLCIQLGRAEEAVTLLQRRLVAVRRPLLRARFLHRLGAAYGSQGRNQEALFHMQAAADLFVKHATAVEQREFVADLARILLAKGDYGPAIEECARALARLPAGEAPTMRARLLLLQAQAERQSGDTSAAEAACRAALDALKPLGRTLELAQAYTQIGNNYAARRDFDQAERFHRAALKVHTEMGDLNAMKGAYNNLGTALFRAGKLEEATLSHQQSLEIKRRLGDRPGEGNSWNNLGNLFDRRGDLRRAFQCYKRGITTYRRLNRPRELATIYHNLGEIDIRLGRFRSAERLLQRAEKHAAGLGGSYVVQSTALNLGVIQLMRRDPQACLQTLNGALQAVQRSGLSGFSAQFHALLALAYASAPDVAQSAVHERLASEALDATVEEETRLEALLHLAETAALLGRSEDAETRARAAEAQALSTAHPYPRVRALRLLAQASLGRGAWDLAEARLEEAADLCRARGFRYELAKCYKMQGHLHWEIGLRARAEEEFQHCVGLLEELGLRTELGLTYLELARLAGPGQDADVTLRRRRALPRDSSGGHA